MEKALFLFFIFTLDSLVTFSSCQDDLIHQVITNSPAKKLKKMQILNPRKFLKVRSGENRKWNLKKRVDRKEVYTVFPTMTNNRYQKGVPDSPFFQPEHALEQKIRVKKVLPDYLFTMGRRKRSVLKRDEAVDSRNVTMNIVKKRRKKIGNITKTDKIKGLKTLRHKEGTNKMNVTKNKKLTNSSTVRIKDTKKSGKRNHRKGKRVETEKLKEKKNNRHDNVEKNLRKNRKSQIKRDSRRLIAGKDAMIADYPYVVSIQKYYEHWCAGALLNPRLVITTANCIWKSDQISRLRVRAGSRHADRGGQLAKIQEVMKHPAWSIRKNPNNDVALILLDRNIRFSDSVHSLDLPNHAMAPAFEDAWVTSWGAERRDGIFQNTQLTLQVYHSRLLARDKCNNVTQRFGVSVAENFICLTQTGRRAPCTRDTGAPAVSDGILWGLASWGIRKLCGTERFPAMFSYLAASSNLDFITNATHYLMSEQRHYPFPDRFQVQRMETKPTTVTQAVEYMY